MTFFNKLLGKSPKKEIKARCPITKESIENGFGYMLTTSQIVASKKYWDMVMTEPETLSYTISHFSNQPNGTQMRNLIFEKYSSIEKPWIISDSCINLFDVDKGEARQRAKQWWENEGNFVPQEAGSAVEKLEPKVFQTFKDYAVLEAGRNRVPVL
ncbi:MAG TPA: hypothetical protein PLV21_04240 [Cyclobacteriaceae bacterium]|nr:hypothetical protein [Cyclobacteriaceae bacterium]HRJ81070.1 hypothetical protein [Cyclobacteriaceae bacterium]